MRQWKSRLAQAWQASPGLCALWLAVMVWRLLAIAAVPVDSDEPQHLHVVWTWTQGGLPYRDVFDNHMPLYQWLCSPLLGWLGERADILYWMRLAQWPLSLLTTFTVMALGMRLWHWRVGVWATIAMGLWPSYFALSTQFRPDNLWATGWLLAMLLATGYGPRRYRAALCGLCVGIACATSMKTILLVDCAALTLLALLPSLWQLRPWPWRTLLLNGLVGLVCALLPLLAIAWYIEAHGIWVQAVYGVFTHNLVHGLNRHHGHARQLGVPLVCVLLAVAAWRRARAGAHPGLTIRRWFVVGMGVVYLAALYGFWPLLPAEHLLPSTPLLALGLVALLRPDLRLAGTPARRWRVGVATALLLELGLSCGSCEERAALSMPAYRDELALLFKLTRSDDTVMDAKGESIYRRRPYFFALENITKFRIGHGLMPDDVTRNMRSNATPVLIPQGVMRFADDFIRANYMPIARRIGVLGQRFTAVGGSEVALNLDIPADYALIDISGRPAVVSIDGKAYAGPMELAAGRHVIRPLEAGDYALIWAPAMQRGLAPAEVFKPRAWPRIDDSRRHG